MVSYQGHRKRWASEAAEMLFVPNNIAENWSRMNGTGLKCGPVMPPSADHCLGPGHAFIDTIQDLGPDSDLLTSCKPGVTPITTYTHTIC